jgi:hypothetical protein
MPVGRERKTMIIGSPSFSQTSIKHPTTGRGHQILTGNSARQEGIGEKPQEDPGTPTKAEW